MFTLFVDADPVLWTTPEVSVEEYANDLSLINSATLYVPLNPIFSVALILVELLTPLTLTWSFTARLWGTSVTTVISLFTLL